jgi:hypothetical protein
LANTDDGSCSAIPDNTCSDLYIAMLGDPDDDARARFAQIYNPTNATVSLSQYTFKRYSNAATSVTSSLSLSGTLASHATYIICADRRYVSWGSFRGGYDYRLKARLGNKACNLESSVVGGNNGDDTYALYKGSGSAEALVDIFGAVGTRGGTSTGRNRYAYFYDGEAVRTLPGPSVTYNYSQWTRNCQSYACGGTGWRYSRRATTQMTYWESTWRPSALSRCATING